MIKRFMLIFLVGVALQATVFAVYYDDLLYLRQPVATLVQAPRDTFERRATRALTRRRLTAKHLETIAAAAAALHLPHLEVRALERRLEAEPSDAALRLRLADALRRDGQLDRAEHLYLDLLQTSARDAR